MLKQSWNGQQYAIDGYRAVDPNFVKSLRSHNPALVIRKTIYLWLQLIAGWLLLLFAKPVFWLPAFVILVASQQSMVTWVHEASHFSLFRSKRLNDIWCNIFFGAPIGMNVESYRTSHMTHHNHLSTEQDRDGWAQAVDWTGFGLIREILLAATGYYGFRILFSKYASVLRAPRTGQAKNDGQSLLFVCAAFVWNGGLFTAAFLCGHWYCYILFWLYPVFSIAQLINMVRTSAEHQPQGFPSVPLSAHPIVRTTIPSIVEKWLIYGINFNYHLEHHLWPFVPFFNLPSLHSHLRERGFYQLHPELVQGSAFARVWGLSRPNATHT